jgi:Leucine Rich repeat
MFARYPPHFRLKTLFLVITLVCPGLWAIGERERANEREGLAACKVSKLGIVWYGKRIGIFGREPCVTEIKADLEPVTLDHARCLPCFPDLESFSAKGMRIRNEVLRYLNGARRLNYLELSELSEWPVDDGYGAPFDDLGDEYGITNEGVLQLTELPSLRTLFLRCPQVDDRGIAHLARFSGLRELSIRWTKATDAGIESISILRELSDLDLGCTGVTNAGIAYLLDMQKLERLCLDHTKVTDEGCALIGRLKTLHALQLENNDITDQAVEALSGLEHLEWLGLQGTRVSAEGRKQLNDKLPHLCISFDE